MIRLVLPWPPRSLHPNSRVHWVRRAKDASACRQLAGWCMKETGIRAGDPDIPSVPLVTAIFNPPDDRRRDLDGMLSSIKSYLDGVADIIGVDDSKWQIAIRKDKKTKGGSVTLIIGEAA